MTPMYDNIKIIELDTKHVSAIDIFIDLTGVVPAEFDIARHVSGLAHDEGLFDGDRRVTIALAPNAAMGERVGDTELEPARIYRNPVTALGDAIAAAARRARALVIVIGPWRWRNQTLFALAEQAMLDPMIATVQPRFSDEELCHLLPLPEGEGTRLPIAAAGFLPNYYVAPECLSALLLLTPRASAAAPRLIASTLKAAYGEVLRGLRRRGYRNLICNRILVPRSCDASPYLPLPDESGATMDLDRDRRRDMWREMPERRLETVLSSAFSAHGHPRILLDCRGMPPAMNGTSVCMLGFLQGFQQLGHPGLQITVVASTEAVEYHRLKTRFYGFEIQCDAPEGRFFAAVLLNQPWSFAAIRELHDLAGLIMFNILDTISWDIIYVAPSNLERAWRAIGQSADVLFFNSAYSRERYRFRFHPDERVALVVTHHSMKPAEITSEVEHRAIVDEPFVLVMGNNYDHKEVASTVETLADAFPYTRFISVGMSQTSAWNATAMESSHLSAGRIARLFTDATVVVFPSHYEGFGLPVGEALAYGKTVIVRDCPLWSEIGKLTRHPERIVPFRIEAELIIAVGDALHGPRFAHDKNSQSRPPAERHEPDWADCARVMRNAIEESISGFDGRRWLARDSMLVSA